jgi:hypothetical protein
MLSVISHFNPGMKCVIDTSGKWFPNDKCRYCPGLKRVFWCIPWCVAGFAHCRLIISVDDTFLIGKYKGTLMVAVGITAGSHLLSLAFVLVGVRTMIAGHGSLPLSERKYLAQVDQFA